ncbi:hypothetical protein HDU81_005838 [Chytriomyces hyalinus]|nr:hypothetical protein HDU81_005838 [Chytriomyces hyalinus]
MKTSAAVLFAVSVQSLLGVVSAVLPVWTYHQDANCQSPVVRAKTRPDDANCQPFGCSQLNNADGTPTGMYVIQLCPDDPISAARASFSPYAQAVEEFQHTDSTCTDQGQGFVMTVPDVCFAPEGGSGSHFRFTFNSDAAVLDQYSDSNCQTNLNVPIAEQFNVCYDRASSPLGGTGYRFVSRFDAPPPSPTTTTTTTTTSTTTTSTTSSTTTSTTTSSTTTSSTTTSSTTTSSTTTTSTTTTETTTTSTTTTTPTTTTSSTTTTTTTTTTSAAAAFTLAAILPGVAQPKDAYAPRLAGGCISKFQLNNQTGLPQFINNATLCGEQSDMISQFTALFNVGAGIAKLNNGFLANGTYVIQIQALNATKRRDTLDSGRGNWNWLYNGINPLPPTQGPPTEQPPQPTEEPPQPTEEPPQPTEEPPQPTEQPPQPTEEPPQPPQPTEQPPQPTEEPPKPIEAPPAAVTVVRPTNVYKAGAVNVAAAGSLACLLAALVL